MYLHKYKVGDRVLYITSGTRQKPATTMINVNPGDWAGVTGGRGSTIAKYLEDLKFSKETEEPVEEKKEQPQETAESVTMANYVRTVAQHLDGSA
jgi:hypothetical protein